MPIQRIAGYADAFGMPARDPLKGELTCRVTFETIAFPSDIIAVSSAHTLGA
jgi:hypothetical protein